MPYEYRTKRQIEFSDTDMAGIAHFSRFLSSWNPLSMNSAFTGNKRRDEMGWEQNWLAKAVGIL